LYDEVKGIDYDDVYLSIIKSYSSTPFALMAAMYLAQGWFECGDRNKADEAFVLLDSVIDNCHEKPQLLTPLYYMMADQYIIHGKRYDKAVDQLQAALQSGVVNPRTREQITFRIARINDVDLGRRETSRLWYERFLREFPTSSDVALVKRYLRELVKPDSGRTPDADSKR
jgi:tetratricopeptide (TPR) repeat protein